MKRYRRWLIPNRSDAHAWAILLLYVTMLLFPLVCHLYMGQWYRSSAWDGLALGALPYLATWLALTAIIGTWNVAQWWRGWPVALLGLGSFAGLIGFSYYLGLLNGGPLEKALKLPVDQYRFQIFNIAGAGLLVGLGSALIGLVARKLGQRFRRIQVSRTRIMIVGAIALFGISICVRIVQRGDGLVFTNSPYLTGANPVWLLLSILLTSLPAWLLQQIRGFWLGFGFVVVYFLATFLLAVSVLCLSMRIGVSEASVWALVYSILFVLMLLLLRLPCERSPVRPSGRRTSKISVLGISVWGFTPAVGLPLFLFLTLWLDPVMLVCWSGPDRWKLARAVRVMETMPGTQARCAPTQWNPGFGGDGLDMLVVLSAETPVNYFAALPQLKTNQFWLAIRNLQSDIDTSPLAGPVGQRPTFVSVVEGKINGRQFHDLVQGAQRVTLSKMVVEPMPASPRVDQAGFVHLSEMRPGEVGRFVNLLAEEASIGELYVSDCDLNRGDCEALFKLSRNTPVQLHFWQEKQESLPADLIAAGQKYRGSQVAIRSPPKFFDERERWELLLSTDIGKTIELPRATATSAAGSAASNQANLEAFWDAVFVARKMSRTSLAVDGVPFSTRSRFLDDCIRYHWAYGPEPIDRQKIESLFLPHFEPWQLGEVGKITSLKSLSLDPAWLPVWQETTSFTDRSRVDLGPLQSLGKLEQLVLPSGLLVQDFDFLQGLKNLESLQFDPGVVDQPLLTPKFCPRLRTVSMFGLPSTRMLRALSQIKTLEKVVLVDSAHHLATEGDLHKVRRLLARRVELEFVDYVDLVPPAFHDHLIEVRRAVRGKHLGFGGEETWSLPPGQGHEDREVVPEYQRWKIEHDAADILEYMKQLQFFDLEIAIIQMEGSVITRLRDVAGNPQVIESKRSEERKTLWFTPRDEKLEEWNESLAQQNGVELDNSFTALFYPVKIRETLRQIEKDWLDKTGRKLIEVRQARFKIVPVEDRFEFRLIGIATRK